MTTKLRQPEYPDTLNQGGWFLPTDYVLVKSLFREDLLRYYVQGMEPGARVLDLNAGTKGLGPDLIARGLSYTALEQNRLVRDVLTSQGLAVEEWRPPRIPRPDASVHLVLSLAFLEHLPGWISALEQLLEIKRVLVPGGRILIIAAHAPGMGATFWDDYKHGWRVSRRRLRAMAADVGLEVIGTRYTIGWITLRGGPAWAACRVVARALNATLNIPPVARFLEAVGLDELSAKVRKTILELVAVEMMKPGGGGRGA